MLINVFICVSQTLLHGNSNFVQAVYEYTVANNIFTALFWIIIVGYQKFCPLFRPLFSFVKKNWVGVVSAKWDTHPNSLVPIRCRIICRLTGT